MELLWDEKFEIGHERIDFEHRIFLDLIISFKERSKSDNFADNQASRLLIEIRKYADFHFTSEENIMIDCGYPDLDNHSHIHQNLLTRLDDEINRFETGDRKPDDLFQFLFEWFALHTTHEDKKIADFLSSDKKAN